MKIIQENEYLYIMENEVELYLKVHCREGYIPGAITCGEVIAGCEAAYSRKT